MPPRPSPPKLISAALLATFAAGGASVASMFLVKDMPSAFVFLCALAALVGGRVALRDPGHTFDLVVASIALALLVTWAKLVRLDVRVNIEWWIVAMVSLPVAALGMFAVSLLTRVARKARREPSHDSVDRVLVAACARRAIVNTQIAAS